MKLVFVVFSRIFCAIFRYWIIRVPSKIFTYQCFTYPKTNFRPFTWNSLTLHTLAISWYSYSLTGNIVLRLGLLTQPATSETWKTYSWEKHLNPFYPTTALHIETSHLSCRGKQMINFSIKYNNVVKWVNPLSQSHTEPLNHSPYRSLFFLLVSRITFWWPLIIIYRSYNQIFRFISCITLEKS